MEVNKIIQGFSTDFQTPVPVCKYMASLIPDGVVTVLEPTKGVGNIVSQLDGYEVTAPDNFFEMRKQDFDCVVTNPPFSSKYAFGVPQHLNRHGMRLGYHILTECMCMSSNVIALMPWFTISDSDVRLRALKKWGLISVTALPRKTFQYARIQTVVLQMQKGYEEETKFLVYDLLHHKKPAQLF
jgi:type I restriction-modification system DNA methylase subunit